MAALLITAVFFLPQLRIDDSPERWLPASTREAWRVLDEHFNFGDTVAVGLEYHRPIRDDDVEPLRKLRQQLSEIKGMLQVYDASLLAEDIEDVPLSQLLDPANAGRFGLYEGALWGRPHDGSQTLLIACELAYPRDPAELHRMRRNFIDSLYRVVHEAESQPKFRDVRFHVAGGILLMDALEKRAVGALIYLPISMLIGLASLVLGFRSLRALALAIGGSLAAMIIVAGFVAWSGGGVGALTISTPTLISIIAIATAVHFASDAADHGDSSRSPAERERLVRWVGLPCFGAAFAAAVGFLMLAFNQLAPVRSLGIEACAGSLLAFFGVFILSRSIPIRRAYAGRILLPDRFGRWSDKLAPYSRPVAGSMLAAMFVLLLLAWPWSTTSVVGLKIDVDPFSFFGPQNHLVQSRNHFLNEGFGLYQLEVILVPRHKTLGDSVDQAELRAAKEFSDRLTDRKDLGVLRVISTQVMLNRQAKFYEELAQLRNTEGTLAVGLKVLRLAGVSQHLAKFNETFKNWSRDKLDQGAIRLTFLGYDRANDGFAALYHLAQSTVPKEFNAYLAGTITSVVHLAQGLLSGMFWGLLSSVLIMVAVCAFLFRSLKLSLIALLPNAFPIVVVYGFMGAVGIPLSSGSSMVATVALGIALNDTIHFILHYQKLRHGQGLDLDTALHETFEHIGRPVVLTGVVFIAGFMIFMLSDFLPLYYFGLLATLAMIAAIAGDLLMLPCLLRTFDGGPTTARGATAPGIASQQHETRATDGARLPSPGQV
jgi:uncharacterized protein